MSVVLFDYKIIRNTTFARTHPIWVGHRQHAVPLVLVSQSIGRPARGLSHAPRTTRTGLPLLRGWALSVVFNTHTHRHITDKEDTTATNMPATRLRCSAGWRSFEERVLLSMRGKATRESRSSARATSASSAGKDDKAVGTQVQ